jgi:hypothetical protein
LSSIPLNIQYVWIRHTIYNSLPENSEDQIEAKGEYRMWRVYIDGKIDILQKIEKVRYSLSGYSRSVFESSNWKTNFEYSSLANRSFELEISIYSRTNLLPITDTYYLDISRSNEQGHPIPIS